ncbi:S1C family serine protease [bacterium]|nr:S1C family serine protease [bacterium]
MMVEFLFMTAFLSGVNSTEPKLETLSLRGGQVVKGEILKEKEDSLVVDIGVEVVVIPKNQISVRTPVGEDGKSAMTVGPVFGQSPYLFSTSDLPVAPIKELVNKFGEAVVQIRTPSGSGSGFVIDGAGHVITNCHVIEGETQITVDIFEQAEGSIRERSVTGVEIVALTPFFDLALLKLPQVEGKKYRQVYLGQIEEVRQGDVAFAIGSPLGLTRSVTEGIISNTQRNVDGQVYLQMTAQISPGNSGGPLFNSRGQVVGVTNMKIPLGEGLGFAIPVNYIVDFLRNREAFAFNKENPNTGYHYQAPPRRRAALAEGPKTP